MTLPLSRNPVRYWRAESAEHGLQLATSDQVENGAQFPPSRVVVTHIKPRVGGGRYPAKRIVGDKFTVAADIFTDGHDALGAILCQRKIGDSAWETGRMTDRGNDAWSGEFFAVSPGLYEYTIEAWIDQFKSWRRDLDKRLDAHQAAGADLETGALLIDAASQRAGAAGAQAEAARMRAAAEKLRAIGAALTAAADGNALNEAVAILSEDLAALVQDYPERSSSRIYDPPLLLEVDREKAGFSAWYEMFPRSSSPVPGRHGTLADCAARLPYVAAMGFDVLYLPPIHPIGFTFRKGKNNSVVNEAGDPGSPWAIGAAAGGHTSIHPELGTLEDFAHLLEAARAHGIEVALDLAFQCSPDHPWVKEHPEWFLHRPDGSIQYAENPPKKYQDIYPLNFESPGWRSLWEALRGVALFWANQGARIFRVDNPHTKPFAFWEWMIRSVKARFPEVIFLAEAFTRPKVMKHLAKIGFSQSYTYFAWRNSRYELTEYFTELTQTNMREYFRPNLWPNTPDILTAALQQGGRAASMIRLVLAATLSASYGIYGPVFELCETTPLTPGKEEYLNAEKYEIRSWNLEQPRSLRDLIARVNYARRENPALQRDLGLRFHPTENERIIAYSKTTEDRTHAALVVVNLDPHNAQYGWVTLPLDELGLSANEAYQAHDMLTDARYTWRGPRNYVRLDPASIPAHLFHLRR